MSVPVNGPGSAPAIASLRREAMACRNVSRSSGVRTIITCGDPAGAGFPSSGSAASSAAGAARTARSRTLTGVSSAASTFSEARAASIASSDPAAPSRADSRADALSAHPAEAGTPSSMPITRAARSGGTFPQAVSTTAAAFSTGPWDTAPACAPGGGSANAAVPQHARERPGSSTSVTVRTTRTSSTCARRGSPASPAPQRRHSAGDGAAFRSSGSGSLTGPFPW